MRIHFFGLLFFSLSSYAHGKQEFVLSLTHLPSKQGSCQAAANPLIEKIKSEFPIQVVSTSVPAKPGCHVDVLYRALDPLPRISDWSYFPSEADCQAGTGKALAFYREATGLQPLYWYCAQYEPYRPWARLWIDGFGIPRLKRFELSSDHSAFNGKLIGNTNQAFAELTQFLSEKGAEVKELTHYQESYGLNHLRLAYFARKPVPLADVPGLNFPNAASCLSQLPKAVEAIRKAVRVPFALCSYEEKYTFTATAKILVSQNLLQDQCFNPKTLTTIYPSLDACEADKLSQVNFHKTEYKQNVKGAYCYMGYSVTAVTRPIRMDLLYGCE